MASRGPDGDGDSSSGESGSSYTDGSGSDSGSGSSYTSDSGDSGNSGDEEESGHEPGAGGPAADGAGGAGSGGDSGGDDDGSSEEGSSSEYTTDDEEEEEPQLKYHRLGASVGEILKQNAATCMAVSDKFIVMGTDYGHIFILDCQKGNEAQRFEGTHSERITDIAIDERGEFIATCADDGKVVIRSVYDADVKTVFSYDRPVKSVAIDPQYSRAKKKQFCTGGLAGELVLNEESSWGLFGKNKKKVLHAGEGPIACIEWRSTFIAWANNLGVKIYDTRSQQRITYIDRPKNSPRPDMYRCRLFWKDDSTLYIGWADSIKVGVIKAKPRDSRDGPSAQNLPSRYVQLVARFTTDFWVCGLAPLGDDLVALAYLKENEAEGGKSVSERPELRLLTMRGEELSSDALSIHGYDQYWANDYHLECLVHDKLFYVISPKDVVVAKPCDLDDHVTWLQSKGRYAEAVRAAEARQKDLQVHDMLSIHQKYLAHLVDSQEYDLAAQKLPGVLEQNVQLWENWIHTFAKRKQLRAVSPFMPISSPRLGRTVYEMVLNCFLREDAKGFQQTIKEWPSDLYDIHKIIPAVKDTLAAGNVQDPAILRETLGELYARDEQYEEALHVYLELGQGDVFTLIEKHKLFHSIHDKVLQLMRFDAKKTVDLLVHHAKEIQPGDVVPQLNNQPEYQLEYLEALSMVDPHAGRQHGKLQVELTAEYRPAKLMTFLKTNFVPLNEAMDICKQRGLIPEQVFLLQRIGNTKRALELIITEMRDVEKAIEFAMEENTDELWDFLIESSMDKPDFIKGLLDNVGTHINPQRLIRDIPKGLAINGLRDSLVKILQDFNLQIELLKGCTNILTNDSVALLQKLNRLQKSAMHVRASSAACSISHEPMRDAVGNGKERFVVFKCGHVYRFQAMLAQFADRPAAMEDGWFCIICQHEQKGKKGRGGRRVTPRH